MRSTSAVTSGRAGARQPANVAVTTKALRASVTAARAHIDDLEAQLEAGLRYAERIHFDARTIDLRVERHVRHSTRLSSLLRCAAELKQSIAEQRSILLDLRASIARMRRALRERRTELIDTLADAARLIPESAPDPGRESGPEKGRPRSARRAAQQ